MKRKKQISGVCSEVTTELQSHFLVLQMVATRFTKKRGALASTSRLAANTTLPSSHPSQSCFSHLLDVIKGLHVRIQGVLSSRQCQCNRRVQLLLLSPFLSQLSLLLSNSIRLINDRISMLWRAKRSNRDSSDYYDTIFSEAFSLHQDVISFSRVLEEVLNSLSSRDMIKGNENSQSESVLHKNHVCRNVLYKISFVLREVCPTCITRVEAYVAFNAKRSVLAILSAHLDPHSKVLYHNNKRKSLDQLISHPMQSIAIIDRELLSSSWTMLQSLDEKDSQHILTAITLNSCCDAILSYILNQKLAFNENGVLELFFQLQELLAAANRAKETLSIPSSVCIVQDSFMWNRANAFLRVLSSSTGGFEHDNETEEKCGIKAMVKSNHYISPSELEILQSLTLPRQQCFCFPQNFLSAMRKRSAVVSILPVLMIENI